jgi:hypothetical protein
MPLVNPTLPNDGESADAGDISVPFLALLAVFNGHIGADNIEPGTIPAALGVGSITTTMLAALAVTGAKIAAGAITPDKVAGPCRRRLFNIWNPDACSDQPHVYRYRFG